MQTAGGLAGDEFIVGGQLAGADRQAVVEVLLEPGGDTTAWSTSASILLGSAMLPTLAATLLLLL